ncbi:MAG TPA: NAD(P)H-dependent oxidoreductase [Polyangiales bacterium]|nr:NAD(P)H-dependent oxidoreductase [Polyangiales bacterium]
MTTILQITSSSRGAASHSNCLAEELSARLLEQHHAPRLIRRDLAAQAVHVLDPEAFAALGAASQARTAAQHQLIEQYDALIAEIRAADLIVLAAPMYNFAVPVQLKAYFDAIARAGVTFRYTSQGPIGLLTGKKVFVVLTRGGVHRDRPSDNQTPFLRSMLAFLGMTDVEYIYAEGLSMGDEARRKGLASARAAIAALCDAAQVTAA